MGLFRQRIVAAAMAMIAISPALWIVGCDDGGGSSGNSSLPEIGSKTLAFYGRVNQWAWAGGMSEDEAADILHSEVKALAAAGWDGYQIEMWSWVVGSRITQEEGIERIRYVFPKLAEWCREENLWLFVSGVNDNQHLGKYGSVARTLAEDSKYVDECLAMILAAGPTNIVVQPVGETQTDDGASVERKWSDVLGESKFYLVNNNGSRPRATKSWSDAYCVHVWSINSAKNVEAEAWVNNDTHRAIVDMSADGTMDGPCNPVDVRDYVQSARDMKRPAIMVYAFGYTGENGIDLDAIGAVE